MNTIPVSDVWRENHPEERRYTWRKSNPLKQSRLDYFLLSDYMISSYDNSDILSSYKSDHSIITLTLKFGEEQKFRNLWKFNCSLLKDKAFAQEINKEIDDVIREYSEEIVEDQSMMDITKLFGLPLTVSDKVFLDFLLMKVRSKAIAYATKKKRENESVEKSLIEEISTLEKIEMKTEAILDLIKSKNQELIALRENKMKGVLLRSKAKWIAEGEKVTKYFCSLEKRHFINKRMTKLNNKKGEVLTNQDQISNEVFNFFDGLYRKRSLEKIEISDLITSWNKLTAEQGKSAGDLITLEEASYCLKNMKNDKSPGSDGFPAEFFKFFWKKLGVFVVRALNNSFEDRELSTTQREGIITCIPKGNKPKEFIKNWRPISLLNVVYKIGSSCVANRLKAFLPALISEDQTGFIKGRYMGDNIRLIYDLMQYLEDKNQPGMLLSLDFEKAFDSLDWEFMFKVLRAFGFGEDFCHWIETFYKNTKSTVIVNGRTTPWLDISRGCRQGDPISPYLFVLAVEILAIMIRENKDIKGIVTNNKENKISQFADDTQLFNRGDCKSFEESIQVVNRFGKASGLFLNEDKTEAIWLGSLKNSKVTFAPHLKMVWNPEQFKILGIWFGHNIQDIVEINFLGRIKEARELMKIWLKRTITPLGRIAILKSLILSKLTQLWMFLPNPPHHVLEQIQKLCYYFVWKGNHDRIKRATVTKTVKCGGLNVPNVFLYSKVLKLMWLRKLKHSKHNWRNVCIEMYDFAEQIERYGSSYLVRNSNNNKFWNDVFSAYHDLDVLTIPKTSAEVLIEPVFFNPKIKVSGKVITFKSWINNGVSNISHFLDDSGKFYDFLTFSEKYGVQTNFLTYGSVVLAVKSFMEKSDIQIHDNTITDFPSALNIVYFCIKNKKAIYETFTNNAHEPNCCEKWESKLGKPIQWKNVFWQVHRIKDIKLKWFQIRLLHRIIATNILLKEMGVAQTSMCSFCKQERESIEHLFWFCDVVNLFWKNLEQLINEKCSHASQMTFSPDLILFGVANHIRTDDVFDLILLMAKTFIYRCKQNNKHPRIQNFLPCLKDRFVVEKFNAFLKFESGMFDAKWAYYLDLLET
jgi:hypothetical protein